jgi:hypothetical protein
LSALSVMSSPTPHLRVCTVLQRLVSNVQWLLTGRVLQHSICQGFTNALKQCAETKCVSVLFCSSATWRERKLAFHNLATTERIRWNGLVSSARSQKGGECCFPESIC